MEQVVRKREKEEGRRKRESARESVRSARGAPERQEERFREEREVVRNVHDECSEERGGDEHERMRDHKEVSN